MTFCDFLEEELLDHVFGLGAYTPATEWNIALSTADPGEDGSGLIEPDGGDAYARVNFTDWARAGSTISNDSDVTFAKATGAWGTITHFAIVDQLGNFLMRGALTTPKVVDVDDRPIFEAGDLQVTLD